MLFQVRVAAARAVGACFANKVTQPATRSALAGGVTAMQGPEEFHATCLSAAAVELKEVAKVRGVVSGVMRLEIRLVCCLALYLLVALRSV